MKEEIRVLRNNFERLESLFQESLEEVDKVKTEYEANLIEKNDKYTDAKAENEELKVAPLKSSRNDQQRISNLKSLAWKRDNSILPLLC